MTLTHWLLIFVHFIVAPVAAIHALIHKRDPRAAFGWITVCIFFPVLGPILYSLFGINRIRTRARKLSGRSPFSLRPRLEEPDDPFETFKVVRDMPEEYRELASVSERITRLPVLGGNHLEILHNGEEAYPAMLEAIEGSEKSLFLSTYILESNNTGKQFVRALSEAVRRGVDVRVLIDGMGEKYSFPRAGWLLKKQGVPVERFLPPRLIPPSIFVNLRNHRKILVADGVVAFCGGMNIGDRHLAGNLDNPSRVADIHFKISGPVVNQLEQVFLETWAFCLGKPVAPLRDLTSQVAEGPVLCRTIIDGPDENIDKFANVLAGAVSSARRNILIMTPYFVPSRELMAALQAAAPGELRCS
jgi:cardiolipin synthase